MHLIHPYTTLKIKPIKLCTNTLYFWQKHVVLVCLYHCAINYIFTKSSYGHFRAEMTSSCVGSGRLSTTLAGYVACTAETVRTGDILAVRR